MTWSVWVYWQALWGLYPAGTLISNWQQILVMKSCSRCCNIINSVWTAIQISLMYMQASMLDIQLTSNQCHGFWRQINLHILPVVWSFAHWVSHNAKSSTLHFYLKRHVHENVFSEMTQMTTGWRYSRV